MAVARLPRVTPVALRDIAKHAEATHATVVLTQLDERLVLVNEDNSRGFDGRHTSAQQHDTGLGLVSMRERASVVVWRVGN